MAAINGYPFDIGGMLIDRRGAETEPVCLKAGRVQHPAVCCALSRLINVGRLRTFTAHNENIV
jgi:hypothetical protein